MTNSFAQLTSGASQAGTVATVKSTVSGTLQMKRTASALGTIEHLSKGYHFKMTSLPAMYFQGRIQMRSRWRMCPDGVSL